MAYERELRVALEAASWAARLILQDYAAFVRIPDAPADISTDTDRRSQAGIVKHILSSFPGDAFCAEESGADLEGLPASGARLWVIDPIDGTRGFARKNGEFSVMIAFVDAGQIAMGVVAEPAKHRLTYATRGGLCWRQDELNRAPETCRVTQVAAVSDSIVTQSHSRSGGQLSNHLRALGPKQVIETYSAGIKLAQVARGEADIYLNTYDACHDWDICAGAILVEEAGGKVTNLRGETPQFGRPEAIQPGGLLATNGHLHPPALAALQSVAER
jgi:3'(2'), 5'-bisphosphate nucleotidase